MVIQDSKAFGNATALNNAIRSTHAGVDLLKMCLCCYKRYAFCQSSCKFFVDFFLTQLPSFILQHIKKRITKTEIFETRIEK